MFAKMGVLSPKSSWPLYRYAKTMHLPKPGDEDFDLQCGNRFFDADKLVLNAALIDLGSFTNSNAIISFSAEPIFQKP
jgi:hypothetical protein